MRCQKDPSDNLHNHLLHEATKISQCINSKIDSAVTADPSLTPSDIASGKGLGFLPAAVENRDTRTYLLIGLQTLVLQIDPQTLAVVKPLH